MTSDVPQLVVTAVVIIVTLHIGLTVTEEVGSASRAAESSGEAMFDTPGEKAAFERSVERLMVVVVGGVLSIIGGRIVNGAVANRTRPRLEMVP